MLRVLITGFEPFNKGKLNPSEQLVLRLDKHDVDGAEIITKVLPVVFSEAAEELLQLIDEHQPDVVICFGQAEGRKNISVERFAVNLDDAAIADNSGAIRVNQKINPAGPTAFESTLPIGEIVNNLKQNNIPAAQSLSAGAFVCNHIFYELQNALVGKDVVSGFVHVPLMNEQQEDFPGQFTMDIHDMVRAAKAIVATVVASKQDRG